MLAIPVERSLALGHGQKLECFVRVAAATPAQEVVIGEQRHPAEVLSGLEEGEEVVLNPVVLLKPSERPAENGAARKGGPRGKGRGESDEGGEGKKAKGKAKKDAGPGDFKKRSAMPPDETPKDK